MLRALSPCLTRAPLLPSRQQQQGGSRGCTVCAALSSHPASPWLAPASNGVFPGMLAGLERVHLLLMAVASFSFRQPEFKLNFPSFP